MGNTGALLRLRKPLWGQGGVGGAGTGMQGGRRGKRKCSSFSFSGGSASDLLTSLEAKLEKQQRDVRAGQRPSSGVRARVRA